MPMQHDPGPQVSPPAPRSKRWLFIATLLMAAAPLPSHAADKTTLKVAYSADYLMSTPKMAKDWFEKIKSGFEKLHPDVTVELMPIAGGFDDMITKLSLMYNNKATAPDVAQIPANEAGQWAEGDLLAPLDEQLKTASWWAAFPDAVKKEGTIDGKVYAVSEGVNTNALLFDRTIFATAGLPDDWQPKTWDDILTAARAVKKASPATWPLWMLTGTAQGSQGVGLGALNLLAGSSDPNFYDTADGKWVVDSKGLRDVIGLYRQASLEGLLAPASQMLSADAPGNVAPFLPKHQIGITLGGNYVPQIFNKEVCGPCWPEAHEQIGFAPLPTSQGQSPGIATGFSSWDLAMYKDSANPTLAWQLIDFMQSKDNMLLVDNYAGFNPPIPAYRTEPVFINFAPGFQEKFANLVSIARGAPSDPGFNVWAFALAQATEAVVLKPQTSVDDAIAMMKTYVSGQLGPDKIEARH